MLCHSAKSWNTLEAKFNNMGSLLPTFEVTHFPSSSYYPEFFALDPVLMT